MRAVLLSHWFKLIEGMQCEPRAFYKIVETQGVDREIPGLRVSKVTWKESGALSADRLYLRFARKRFFFEICCAPFGTGTFVSSRLMYKNPVWTLFHWMFVLNMLTGFGWLVFYYFRNEYLLTPLSIAGFCITLLFFFFRLAPWTGMEDVILATPIIGAFYAHFFDPLTYYKIDLLLSYQEAVHGTILHAIDQLTTDKAVKPLTELERRPVYADLMKR